MDFLKLRELEKILFSFRKKCTKRIIDENRKENV